ncbi:MAG TPA: DUF2480 family protein [Puia sp.]|nr:DUF2480 family protein [Puia sp.]
MNKQPHRLRWGLSFISIPVVPLSHQHQPMSEEIVNKVAQSALQTLDLEDYYPREEIVLFDLKPYLFMEKILREKDFRAALQQIDWARYQDKIVAVTCSVDAIIPLWSYMLIAVNLQPFARDIVMGNEQTALQQAFLSRLAAIDIQEFTDKRVIVKGCGDLSVGGFAYMEIARRLRPVVKSIMYGEACSNVPVYKKK